MIKLYVLLLCKLLIQLSNGRRYRCPTDENTISRLSPCYCGLEFAQAAWKVTVVCKGFVDPQTLRQSLRVLDDYHIDELIIYGANLRYLPKNVFNTAQGVEINTISIIASIVGDVAEDSAGGSFFEGLRLYLRILRVEWSKGIGYWNWNLVANSLNGFSVTPGDPPPAAGGFVGFPSALEEIYLYKNDMNGALRSNFDSMSFNDPGNPDPPNYAGLQPTRVIIRQNGLKFIGANFNGFQNMRVLDLSWNALETTGSLFTATTTPTTPRRLQTLYLNNNKLTKLLENDNVWSTLSVSATATVLEFVDYRGNKINCNFNANERLITGTPIRTGTPPAPLPTPAAPYDLEVNGVCYSPINVRYRSLMSALRAAP